MSYLAQIFSTSEKVLMIAGLFLNVVGAVILAIPLLKTKVKIDEEEIIRSGVDGKSNFWITRRLFNKNKCFGLWGIGLTILGFLLQLFAQW